ncbi:MAG: hypothetical protein ABIU96_04105 [Rhodanobacter sp.]
MGTFEEKPLASAMPDGRIAVYIAAAYQYISRAQALHLISAVQRAVGLPAGSERDMRELELCRTEAELASRTTAHPLAQNTIAMMRARIATQLIATETDHD